MYKVIICIYIYTSFFNKKSTLIFLYLITFLSGGYMSGVFGTGVIVRGVFVRRYLVRGVIVRGIWHEWLLSVGICPGGFVLEP